MSEEVVYGFQGESGDRMLSLGSVRIHNRHVSGGRKSGSGCRICEGGLEGALAPVTPVPAKEDEVAKGDGGDKKDDPTPPSDPWAAWR